MVLREIGRFNYKDYEFIILESKEKEKEGKTLYNYWITIKSGGMIDYIIGEYERNTAEEIWNYILYYGLKYYINRFEGIEEE